MIRHSFKMIWAERKSNSWILIELIIVFSILWFCSDYIYRKGKQYLEPTGIDIEHTYLLRFDYGKDIDPKDFSNDYDFQQDGITILDRLKKYQGIESCCYSQNQSTPYSGSYSMSQYEKDSIDYSYVMKPVSLEYYKVFNIKFQAGKTFDSDIDNTKNKIVASPDKDNKFFKEDITQLREIMTKGIDPSNPPKTEPKTKEEWKPYIIDIPIQVVGVVNKIKRSEFDDYQRIVFSPMSIKELNPKYVDFSIRVKPEVDKNFVEKFQKEMGEQLKVGPFELKSIKPYSECRDEYFQMTGLQKELEMLAVVMFFLLLNVFLGILGTFRFRANMRRGEIGLRAALGSTKRKIQQLLLTETFLMLFLASIPGTIIAFNVYLFGIGPKLNVSSGDGKVTIDSVKTFFESGILNSFLMTYIITFVIMLIIIWLGTWYPARKASQIQPAEALHYE